MTTATSIETKVEIERNDENLLLCLNKLAVIMKKDYDKKGSEGNYSITFEFGSKYIKIIKTYWNSVSVAGFIVCSHNAKFPYGTMLKAASFKAPALNFSRGDIFEIEGKKVPWTGIQ